MGRDSGGRFFDALEEQMATVCAMTRLIGETPQRLETLRALERQEERTRGQLTMAVERAFLTPLERTDLLALSQSAHRAAMAVGDVLIWTDAAGISRLPGDPAQLTRILERCACAAAETMAALRRYRVDGVPVKQVASVQMLARRGQEGCARWARRLWESTDARAGRQLEVAHRLEAAFRMLGELAARVERAAVSNS